MNITVRTWNEKELNTIWKGTNPFLSTIFMNVKTFSNKEGQYYPYHLRKTYKIKFINDIFNPITVYATDDKSLRKFLKAEYHYKMIINITETITEYRKVKL